MQIPVMSHSSLSKIKGMRKNRHDPLDYTRRRLDSFPTFTTGNIKFQIESKSDGKLLSGPPLLLPMGSVQNVQFMTDDGSSSTLWWYNTLTSQLVVSHTSVTLCMDIVLEDVVTNVCNNKFETQRWMYDGNYILAYNKSCLSIPAATGNALELRTCGGLVSQGWFVNFAQGLPSDYKYSIQNVKNNRCIDVSGSGSTSVGSHLALLGCTGASNQVWLRPRSDLRIITSATSLCIDWYNMWDIWLSYCSDALQQKWTYDGSYVRSVFDPRFCLSSTDDGNGLICSYCSANPLMQWKASTIIPPTETNFSFSSRGKSFSIQSQANHMCIDIPGANTDTGGNVQMWECNGTPAQAFWISDSDLKLQTTNGRCIEWYRQNSIILNKCQDSTLSQQWLIDTNFSIIKSMANITTCLSLQPANATRGTLITFSSCDTTDPHMKWDLAAFGSKTTLQHYGDFSGFYFAVFRCPINTIVSGLSASYDLSVKIIRTLSISCDDGWIQSYGDRNTASSSSIATLTIIPCPQGYLAANSDKFYAGNLICESDFNRIDEGLDSCPHSNTSSQRVIGANIWYSSDQFYGIEPVCDRIYGGNYSGAPFSFQCPPPRVSGLTVSCAIGLESNLTNGWSYAVGGKSGNRVNNAWCSASIRGVRIWYDLPNALFGIRPTCSDNVTQSIIGVEGKVGGGDGEIDDFHCPTNTSIVGISGNADNKFVHRLSFICGETTRSSSEPQPLYCPSGKNIVKLSVIGNSPIRYLQATCDGGTVLGPIGNAQGGESTAEVGCDDGISGAEIAYGEYVGNISLICNGRSDSSLLSVSRNYGNRSTFQCPSDQVISAIQGTNSQSGLESLFFVCSTNPALSSDIDLKPLGYGFVTGLSIFGIPLLLVWFLSYRHHKREYKKKDEILPLT